MEGNVVVSNKSKIKVQKPKSYKVVMHNDDFTSMEFVVAVLVDIFKKSIDEANQIMLDVHNRGVGIAGIYSYDIAITKVATAMALAKEEGFPFKLTVEEA